MTNKSIPERLKEERKRLKLTQASVADIAGISRETWSRYEKGAMSPGMEVLAALAMNGGDVNYVLTGSRSNGVYLSNDELELLTKYRAVPFALKAAAHGALGADLSEQSSIKKENIEFNIQGSQGVRIVGRDSIINKK